jgi:hypothetical protein
MTHTIPDTRHCLVSQHNGSRPAEPVFLLTSWHRQWVIEALHAASEAKITEAEACKVCADWPDRLCAICNELVAESLELIDLARLILRSGAR